MSNLTRKRIVLIMALALIVFALFTTHPVAIAASWVLFFLILGSHEDLFR